MRHLEEEGRLIRGQGQSLVGGCIRISSRVGGGRIGAGGSATATGASVFGFGGAAMAKNG